MNALRDTDVFHRKYAAFPHNAQTGNKNIQSKVRWTRSPRTIMKHQTLSDIDRGVQAREQKVLLGTLLVLESDKRKIFTDDRFPNHVQPVCVASGRAWSPGSLCFHLAASVRSCALVARVPS
jgi:hypothetical protein